LLLEHGGEAGRAAVAKRARRVTLGDPRSMVLLAGSLRLVKYLPNDV
jgi:hypothetical protein